MDQDILLTEKMDLPALTELVNQLIEHDFTRLIQLLYRMDISETKLKALLAANHPGDAGRLIANLILEREAEKQQASALFKQPDTAIPEAEKW